MMTITISDKSIYGEMLSQSSLSQQAKLYILHVLEKYIISDPIVIIMQLQIHLRLNANYWNKQNMMIMTL